MFLQAANVSQERKHFRSWHDTVQHCANMNTDVGEYIGAFVIAEREKKTCGSGARGNERKTGGTERRTGRTI